MAKIILTEITTYTGMTKKVRHIDEPLIYIVVGIINNSTYPSRNFESFPLLCLTPIIALGHCP